jgi:MFS family permease
VLIAGIIVFALASLLGGTAHNAKTMLEARLLQGTGGALMASAVLGSS